MGNKGRRVFGDFKIVVNGSVWDGSVSIDPLTDLASNQTIVATAGTAVQLASSQAIKSVTIKALHTNTDVVYVGDSSLNQDGYPLLPTDGVTIMIDDPSKVYIDSEVNGEGVGFILGS